MAGDKFTPIQADPEVLKKMREARSCLTCAHNRHVFIHAHVTPGEGVEEDLTLYECVGFGENPPTGKHNEHGKALRFIVAGEEKGQETTDSYPRCSQINREGDCPRHETYREQEGSETRNPLRCVCKTFGCAIRSILRL